MTHTGRPSALTEEVRKTICQGILDGLTIEGAAAKAGVTRRTVQRWLSYGRRTTEGVFCHFCREVRAAHEQRRKIQIVAIPSSLKRMRYSEAGTAGLVRMMGIADQAAKEILELFNRGRVPDYCQLPALELAMDKLYDRFAEQDAAEDGDFDDYTLLGTDK